MYVVFSFSLHEYEMNVDIIISVCLIVELKEIACKCDQFVRRNPQRLVFQSEYL